MGLSKPFLRFIAYEHKKRPFTGPVLTLGRQSVQATLDEACQLLRSQGITPAPLPPGEGTRTNIPGWFNTVREKNISDVAFFKLMGVTEVMALDYSDYEGVEIEHDLNSVVPDELENRFDLIVDGGTLEHVFDVRQALMNIALMLKPGGRVIHFSPASNHVNHGFYQFSPTLFLDYYGANGFGNLKAYLVEHNLSVIHPDPVEWSEVGVDGWFASNRALETVFVAEKLTTSTVHVVPMQSLCYQEWTQDEPGGTSTSSALKEMIKRTLPEKSKVWLRRYVPGLDPKRKPWGLKRWDRL